MVRKRKKNEISTADKIFIFLGVTGLSIGGYQLYLIARDKKREKTPSLSESVNYTISNGNVIDVDTSTKSCFIKEGDRGKNVRTLQNWILTFNRFYLPLYGVDGIWGDETTKALNSIIGKKTTCFTENEFRDIERQAVSKNLIFY